MVKLTRAVFSLCIALASSQVCLSQEPQHQNAKGRKSKPSAESTAVVSKPLGYHKQVGQANVNHIAAWNRTQADVYLPDVYQQQNLSLAMNVTIDVAGKKVVKPEVVVLYIFYPQGDLTFSKTSELSIEADGKQFDLGVMRRDHRELLKPGGAVSKSLAKDIEFGSFEHIANSKHIKIGVADVEFSLDERQSEALRDLLKTIEQ